MPGTNENQVLNQIENFCVFDLLEHEEVVTDGTVIGEDFTPQQIKDFSDFLQGTGWYIGTKYQDHDRCQRKDFADGCDCSRNQ